MVHTTNNQPTEGNPAPTRPTATNTPKPAGAIQLPFPLEWASSGGDPEIGVSTRGMFVVNPFTDEGQTEEVDPLEYWGLTPEQAQFIVDINAKLKEAVEDAINAGCLRLQNASGITDGGFAGLYFSGPPSQTKLMEVFAGYIVDNINFEQIESEKKLQSERLTG